MKFPPESDLDAAIATIERILHTNVLPFWRDGVGGPKTFGYLVHDATGPQSEAKVRGLVTQSRTLWLFSRLLRSSFGAPGDEALAARGLDFLAEHMWDRAHGGFFWKIDEAGRALEPHKDLYGQAFALFALSECALATGWPKAGELARATFDVLETRFHDRDGRGYHEFFLSDWQPHSKGRNYIGGLPGHKLLNGHMHTLEAVTTYLVASDAPVARERLHELCGIMSRDVVRSPAFATTERHLRDWRSADAPGKERVSYGHDLENLYLLIAARDVLGLDNKRFLGFYLGVLNDAIRFGEDWSNGGFFHTGPLARPADDLKKVWWVQAEALLACCTLHRLAGDRKSFECFLRTLDWITARQIDWQGGEWFNEILPDGRSAGAKAGLWKAGYHTGRALLQCHEVLTRLKHS